MPVRRPKAVPMTATAFTSDSAIIILDRHVRAPSDARRFLADRLSGWEIAGGADGALVASELVTNALVHGEGSIIMRLLLDVQGGLVIEVWDQGESQPQLRPPRLSGES